MRIGWDVDGVLAQFNAGFIDCIEKVTGRCLFPRGYVPDTWDYPQTVGYTPREIAQVWDAIEENPHFWLNLKPYPETTAALARMRWLEHIHDYDTYYITSRPGTTAKTQTEQWLRRYVSIYGTANPTVLISSDKGFAARALKLDAYIDDKWENAVDVADYSPMTRVFLLQRPWNQDRYDERITYVDTLDAFLARIEPSRQIA